MRAADLLARVLAEAGIDTVFGLPGAAAGLVFDSLHRQSGGPRFVLTRHEQSAPIMADVCGRLTGKPGVALGQGVFMASSGLFGLMEAALSSSPMLVICDTSEAGSFAQHGPYQGGTGDYGSTDLPAIFRATAKYVAYATTPKEIVQGAQLGLKHALAGRPGPSVLLCRGDALEGEVDERGRPPLYATGSYLQVPRQLCDPSALAAAAEALARAERPAIVAGNGVHVARAHDLLRQLAERLGAPVATSAKGRSAIEDTHPCSVGLMGSFGRDDANRAVGEADLVLVVGCKLGPNTTRREHPELIDPCRQTIVQVDVDPRNAGWVYPVQHPLVGHVDAVLRQLLDGLDVAGAREAWFRSRGEAPAGPEREGVLHPRRIVEVLNDVVPAEANVVLDAGKNRLFTMHGFRAKRAGSMLVPGGIAGMGWSIPAAVAAKLVEPGRPCVGVAGDGGFAMTIHTLSTAAQYGAAAVFVVMNDSALGWTRDNRLDMPHVAEFPDTDFARIAEGFGCRGVRVRDAGALAAALREGLASDRPTVIDVATDREASHREIYRP